MRNKPEVLAPANSLEVLKTAVEYGADAVYIGGEMYGLRAKAKNFSAEDMKKGIAYAHERGKKVYVTANITAHNRDLEGVRAYFHELKEIRPDALIISDPGVFTIAKEVCPEIDIHISTQSNNVNYMTFRFWKEQGATRVVTARELSLEEIGDIRKNIPDDFEIETFVHGAMPLFYRKRCKPRGLHAPMPLEILYYGRKTSGRISAGRGKRAWNLYFQFQRSMHD